MGGGGGEGGGGEGWALLGSHLYGNYHIHILLPGLQST